LSADPFSPVAPIEALPPGADPVPSGPTAASVRATLVLASHAVQTGDVSRAQALLEAARRDVALVPDAVASQLQLQIRIVQAQVAESLAGVPGPLPSGGGTPSVTPTGTPTPDPSATETPSPAPTTPSPSDDPTAPPSEPPPSEPPPTDADGPGAEAGALGSGA
jgi:hypothetical protein